MRRSIFKAGVFAFVVALGCASDSTTSALSTGHTLASITVALSATNLTVGRTAQATATLLDDAGQTYNGATVSWSSSNAAVASVSSSGLVTAASAGNAVITASALGKTASAAVSVSTPLPVSVATILVTLDSGALHVGNTARANAVVKDSAGNLLLDRAVSWSTSNPILAVVSGLGIVTAVAPGSVSISGAAEGRVGSAAVTILGAATTPGQPAAPTVALSLDATTIPVGQSAQATAILKDSTGAVISAGGPPVWSSSDETVVTVGTTGTITAISTGTAAVTATFAKASGTTVVVTKPPTPATVASVSVVVSSPLTIGVSATAVAIPKDSAGHALTGRTVSSWVSTDPTVASVSISGVVTPLKNGTTSIAATISGVTGSAPVNVGGTPTIAAVTVVVDSNSLVAGHTGHASANPRDASGTLVGGKTPTWSSSNSGIVTVGTDGSFTGVASGSADVIATFGTVTGKATVTVGSVATLASVTVSVVEGPTISAPGTAHATAVLKSSTGSVMSGTVTWATSNAGVVGVGTDGTLTGVNPGSATVTATSGGKSGAVSVTVTSTGPTTIVDPEPTYNPSTQKLIYNDNFDSYANFSALTAAGWLGTGGAKTADFSTNPLGSERIISPGHGGTGQAIRLDYNGKIPPTLTQESHNYNRLLNDTLAGQPGHTLYISYYFRLTAGPGLSIDQDITHHVQIKWLELWTVTDRAQFNTGYEKCGRSGGGKYGQPLDGGGTNFQFYGNGGGNTDCQATQAHGPWAADGQGDWHRLTYKYVSATAKGANDGTAQMWYDGVLIVSVDPRYCGKAMPGAIPYGIINPPHWCETADLAAMFSHQYINYLEWGGTSSTYLWPFTLDFDDMIAWRDK